MNDGSSVHAVEEFADRDHADRTILLADRGINLRVGPMTHRQRVLLGISIVGLVVWWVSVIPGDLPTWLIAGPIVGTIVVVAAWLKVRRDNRNNGH